LAERHERHRQRERGDNWCPFYACTSFFIGSIGLMEAYYLLLTYYRFYITPVEA
jgi:hypothetical protein